LSDRISIGLIIVGENLDDDEIQGYQALVGVTRVGADDAHNNHIHIRFTVDEKAHPRVRGTLSARELDFVPGDPEASKNRLTWSLRDEAGHPFLPWTRIIFEFADDTGPDTNDIMRLRSTHPSAPRKLWVNWRNEDGRKGEIALNIICLDEGESTLQLKDLGTKTVIMTVPLTCSAT